ncbi:hypothetical protein [Mucilaginibacter dorajii]|uniref:DUF7832 domain-containing protein n=1 Tax=Mucilaginibacter dorajii TaxID=692994 RepID=A0ABP7PKU2_9SPHI|nr:hypothetical protein [Mucilaginibacter dorajii]MCS3733574.1 hypothetical protein [Mucilaginibacter dorajii]
MASTYLTKIVKGKTYHFKATVEDHVVNITEGVFYNWLDQSSEGCRNNDNAIKKQQELVNEKLNEGYQITAYSEVLENSIYIYDKAKWHFGGNFPDELDDFQGYVHTGMYLGWLISRNLVSGQFETDHEQEIALFKKQGITGSQIFERCCDGVLMLEDINEIGNRFSLPYFNFNTGQYLDDYEATLLQSKATLYHVDDNWENYNKLKFVLDERFDNWNMGNSKKTF